MASSTSSFVKPSLIAFIATVIIIAPFLLLIFPRSRFYGSSMSGSHWGFLGRQSQLPAESSLDRILRVAAMPDKTVVITSLNQAWAAQNAMIDLFFESFHIGNGTAPLLSHLIIVAFDQTAYQRCLQLHSHCFELRTEGVDFSGEKIFMTEDYLRMIWRRVKFLGEVIGAGYNVLFTDADILWLRSPFPLLSPDADFQIACDRYYGDSKSLGNAINAGFVFTRSNNKTIEFYKYWYEARERFPGMNDQEVLEKIKRDSALRELHLQWWFFNTKHVAGFCQMSRDVEVVCTVHANCCYGLESKLEDLRLIVEDWKLYRAMTGDDKRRHTLRWSAPKACLTSSKILH